MTFLEESIIRTNVSICGSRKSLAAILNISPSAAAEVAVHGNINEKEPSQMTAHQLFDAWADSTNTHEKDIH